MTTEELRAFLAAMKKEAEGDSPYREEAKCMYEAGLRTLRERECGSEEQVFSE